MQLAAARIFVSHLEEARDFYRDKLGLDLEFESSSDGFCKFRSGGVQILLETVPPEAPPEDQALVGRFLGLSFAVEDIRTRHDHLQAMGVAFVGPPELQPWGGMLATLADPSGNTLQIVQYPVPSSSWASR